MIKIYELYNFLDGNDDILSDNSNVSSEVRQGMWGFMPYSVSDGEGVQNEGFNSFVMGEGNVAPEYLTQQFTECVSNLKENIKKIPNQKKFFESLLKIQEYLQARGELGDKKFIFSEEEGIPDQFPDVEPMTLDNRSEADMMANAFAQKMGLTQPYYLGGGSAGYAYRIGNNQILKITTDPSEAAYGLKIMRAEPKTLANIFDIYKIYNTETKKSYFVLIEEDIVNKPVQDFNQYINIIDQLSDEEDPTTDFVGFMKLMKRDFDYQTLAQKAERVLTAKPEANIAESDRKAAYQFLIGLMNIRAELLNLGIDKSFDYSNVQNLGYRGNDPNTLVYFDIGGRWREEQPHFDKDKVILLPEGHFDGNAIISGGKYFSDKFVKDVASKLGANFPIKQLSYLGTGCFGDAYDIGDNRVLKLTTDKSEALENLALVGRSLKYIAEPYDVFKLKSKSTDKEFYAIVLEKLRTDPALEQKMERLKYVFEKILKLELLDVLDDMAMYGYVDPDDKAQVDTYMIKNKQDKELFDSLVNIVNEVRSHGIESYDYINYHNLGYKPNGALAFFDLGFGNCYKQTDDKPKELNVVEDSTAKFSHDDGVGRDDFPTYNNNSTEPSIENNLDANSAMYNETESNNIITTEELIEYAKQFKSDEDLLRNGGFPTDLLDKAAFGFSEESIKTLMPNQLKIKWRDDLENVKHEIKHKGLSDIEYAKSVDLTEPIKVVFDDKGFHIDDGHHRYYAAKILNKPLNVELEIKSNPITKLSGGLGYDKYHREVWKKANNITEDLEYYHVAGDATKDEYQLTEVTEGGGYIAYHGSDHKIDKFTDEFVGAEEATDQEGPGIYFTTSPEDASAYGNFLYTVRLSPKKLVDESSHEDIPYEEIYNLIKKSPRWDDYATNWAEDPEDGVNEAIQSFMDYAENEKDLFQQIWYDFFRYEPIEFVRGMVSLGYDGQIIKKEGGRSHIIVYNPNIIELINVEKTGEEISERKKSYMPGSQAVNVKKKCRLAGLGNTSAACNQGDISNLELTKIEEIIQQELKKKFQQEINEATIPYGRTFWGWVSPDNQFYQVPKLRHRDLIEKIYPDLSWDMDALFDKAFEDGWVRVSYEHESPTYSILTMNTKDEKRVRDVFKTMFFDLVKYGNNQIILGYDKNDGSPEWKSFSTWDSDTKAKLATYISEEINRIEANDTRSSIQTLLDKKRGVAFTSLSPEMEQQVIAAGLKVLPLEQTNHDGVNYVIFRPEFEDDAKKLYNFALSKGGYLHDETPDEARYVGKLLGYKDVDIEGYVRRVYPDLFPSYPEKSPEDYSDFAEGHFITEKELMDMAKRNYEEFVMENNIMSLQNLPFKDAIEGRGGKIYSVGGAVRDEFLGKESKDLDILITGIPMNELEQILSQYGRVNAVGKSFGILKFKPKGGEEIDVAIPRTERPSGEGGHKGFDVTSDHLLPIEKDLERRDFTINAIAKSVGGEIVDPYGGQGDLKDKIIRVVNPEAFSDDPLRMLRAVQFAARFGFGIEPTTMRMIQDNADRIKEIPAERVLTEFDKIIQKGNKRVGAQLLKDTGLFQKIFGFDLKQSTIDRSPFEDVKTMGEFIFLLTRLLPNPAEFYKNNLKGDLDTYKEIKAIDYAYENESNNLIKNRMVAHNVYSISPKTLNSQILPEDIENTAQELLSGKFPKTIGELDINGNDLMQIGLEGKEIGDMLKAMLIHVYGGNVRNNKQELLNLLKTELWKKISRIQP